MKRILRALAGIAIIALGLFVGKALIGMKETRPVVSPPKAIKLVKVTEANPQAAHPMTYIQGRTRALDRMEVFAEVNGVVEITKKAFRNGVRFEKGEVMIKLDAKEAELALVAQRSAFMQLLTGALADIKVDYAKSYEGWKQYTASLEVNEPLPAIPEAKSDQEKFFLSNRGIYSQYFNVKSAEERLSKYTLVAPFSGEVMVSNVNHGALVRSGQKLGEFVSTTGFEVESAISGGGLKVVEIGDSVSFRIAASGVEVPAVVSRISRSIDPNTQTAMVYCTVNDTQLRDGVYLSGVIFSAPMDEVIRIPLELLVNDTAVFTVEADSLLRLQSVVVAHKSDKDALIKGLSRGSKLLAEPVANAFDGMPVTVNQE